MSDNAPSGWQLDVGPYKASPYDTTEVVTLDIGYKPTRYCIHRAFLSQSKVLVARAAYTNTLSLPDLNENTAHILVHYLYFGVYQALAQDSTSAEEKKAAYESSVAMYCAAVRYELHPLAELAREEVTSLSKQASLPDILQIAREEAFPKLPQEDVWFATHLYDTIEIESKRDPDLFLQPWFLGQLSGDQRFLQIVVRAIMDFGSKKTAEEDWTGQSPSPVIESEMNEDPFVNGQHVDAIGKLTLNGVNGVELGEEQSLPSDPKPTLDLDFSSEPKCAPGPDAIPEPVENGTLAPAVDEFTVEEALKDMPLIEPATGEAPRKDPLVAVIEESKEVPVEHSPDLGISKKGKKGKKKARTLKE